MSVNSDVSKSYQISGSQGINGLTTQSSLYGMNPSITLSNDIKYEKSNDPTRDKSPLSTVVRIRGRHNQMVETKGHILMTLDEEKKIQEKKKQLRRSNDRLKMLEQMEKDRQAKVEQELERLMNDKAKREAEELRKRDLIKLRKQAQGALTQSNELLPISELKKSQI
ncbi:UNKNOWN [Stylonychia lemnae]|uniref:Uncharacterized protein n=1 Tax=Stylonychia lemnae TaxID=5949 RepID=A0A078ANI9_STYLE|nr:UNKNOWN [Stylonychia lemnae]|eukprot:CDW83905.1 UNKNOWN [Stylonychia lemnae]